MIGKVFSEKMFCSLDIGTHKIKGSVLRVNRTRNKEELELINVNESRLYGFEDAHVSNLSELADSINSALKDLTKKCLRPPKEIQLGISGDLVSSRPVHTTIPLADRGAKAITSKDIEKANHQAKILGTKMDEEVLHYIPLHYHIDESDTLLDPNGLYARKLGVDAVLYLSNENRLRNISKAVNQAGYEVDNIFFSSYVAAEVALSEEERKYGCGFLDIGSRTSTLFIFKDNRLKSSEILSWGGDMLTEAIAKQLNLAYEMAEDIKKSYAVAMDGDKYKDEEILLKKEDAYRPIKRAVVTEAVMPEVEKLTGIITDIFNSPGRKDDAQRGAVVVGGGALMPGIIEKIGLAAGVPVRLGKINFPYRRDLSQEILYLSATGLAYQGYRKSYPRQVLISGQHPWYQKVLKRGKELYEEYF